MKLITQPLRPLINMMAGQNYWFNGCMDFLMECLGEDREYDYWFFSGVTGDSFTQIYSKDPENMVLCLSGADSGAAAEKAFAACGYGYDYITDIGDTAAYLPRIREYIDRGVPAIGRLGDGFRSFVIICGYDDNAAYCISGEDTEPVPCDCTELIFITEKTDRPGLAEVYRDIVMSIPSLFTLPETGEYSYGKRAFINWAESFQNNMFDKYGLDEQLWHTHIAPDFSCWNMHGTYLCILGTNGCALGFLAKALKLCPDMEFINNLLPLFYKLCMDGFGGLIEMEGGFSLVPEVLKDRERMKPISDRIMELAELCDEILEVFS